MDTNDCINYIYWVFQPNGFLETISKEGPSSQLLSPHYSYSEPQQSRLISYAFLTFGDIYIVRRSFAPDWEWNLLADLEGLWNWNWCCTWQGPQKQNRHIGCCEQLKAMRSCYRLHIAQNQFNNIIGGWHINDSTLGLAIQLCSWTGDIQH